MIFGSFSRPARLLLLFALTLGLSLGQLWARPAQAYTDAQYQTMAQSIAADLSSRVGQALSKPFYITTEQYYQDKYPLGNTTGETIPVVQHNRRWADARELNPGATAWSACLIVLPDNLASQDGQRGVRSILAHELYHCYQFERIGLQRQMPDWLTEGSAMWVGEEYVGGTPFSRPYWRDYLSVSRSIYDRSYDAMGAFAHLKNRGANVWLALNSILDNPNSEAGFVAAAQATGEESFLRTWATGLARQSSWGSEWDTSGPAITSDRRQPTQVGIPGEISFRGGAPGLVATGLPSGQIVQINANLYGALRFGADATGQTVNLSPGFSQRYCVGESCRCSDGSTPSGVTSVPSGDLVIAGVGGLSRSAERSVTITVQAPDCPTRPNPPGGGTPGGGTPGGGAAGWGGGDRARGTSYGDPHIITYDGYRYSFQTVGEFILSKSEDGRFEVQARQAQVPGQALSLNVAAALRLGDQHLGIYAQGSPDGQTPLWVDGSATDLGLNERLSLPGGGQVSRTGELDYFVEWPTGETVAIKGITAAGASFINITPEVPRQRAGQLSGLLGDLNGNASDDLRLRNGQVVPSQDAYAPVTQLISGLVPVPLPLNQLQTAFFDQLYREFGDSWRLTQSESLFDYGAGQSTASLSDLAFPRRYPSLAGVAPEQIAAANRTCEAAGVEAALLEGCVFDVAATGESGFADAAVNAIAEVVLDQVRDRIIDQIEDVIPLPFPIPGFPF